jgi:outer membrane protein TolC
MRNTTISKKTKSGWHGIVFEAISSLCRGKTWPRMRCHATRKEILTFFFVILFSGCVNQQKEVSTYRKVLDEKSPTTHPAYEPRDTLSLPQALDLSNEHYEQLAISGEDYLQALIDKDRVFAAFLPTIGLNPSYLQQEKAGTGGIMGLLAPSLPSHAFDLPITAQMNIFNGFRDVAAMKRADATIDQRKAMLLNLQQTVLLEVAQTYYEIILSEHEVEVLKNTVDVQESRVKDIRSRQQVGLARPLDIEQTEAQASSTRVMLIRAKTNVQNARSVLAFLTGQPAIEGPLTDHFTVPSPLPSREAFQAQGQENRKDLQAAVAGVRAAFEILQSAIRQYLPSVNLSFQYFFTRQTLPKNVDWNLLFPGNVPIFTGGVIEANIRTAWSLLRQAKLNESFIRRKVNQDVQIALQNVLASEARLKELATELKAAQEAYRQAVESYKVGLATNLETLIAQDQLLRAQLQLTSEEFNHKIFYLNLLKAAGQMTLTGK